MARRGHIEGIVFKDDQAQGMYTPGMPPLAGVEVVLDNVRSTRTDSSGRFRFDDVPYGRHRVEARYASDQPTFFTTPSPADVDGGSSVQFGIALSRSSLRGVVLTDAGTALSGVLVHIAGADRRTTVRTADDGTFIEEGVLAGDYDVTHRGGLGSRRLPGRHPRASARSRRAERAGPRQVRAAAVTAACRPGPVVQSRDRPVCRAGWSNSGAAAAAAAVRDRRQRPSTPSAIFRRASTPSWRSTTDASTSSAVSVPDGPALVKDIDVAVLPGAGVAAGAGTSPGEHRRAAHGGGAGIEEPAESEEAAGASAGTAAPSGVHDSGCGVGQRAPRRGMVDELKSAGHAAYLEPSAAGSERAVSRARRALFEPGRRRTGRRARSRRRSVGECRWCSP